MDKDQILNVIKELKEKTKKRKFSQAYDLIINLKNLDIKSNPVEVFASLTHPKTIKPKIAALVDQELAEQATKLCDLTIREKEFQNYNDKKTLKKLANDYDYFIAQANIMGKLAQVFGKVLGTKGKMPNPKMGCVVPPNANLAPLVKKLQSTVKLSAKKASNLQCLVGKEDQPEDHIAENVLAVYQTVLKQLPQEKHNIKNVQLKLTMGKPLKITL